MKFKYKIKKILVKINRKEKQLDLSETQQKVYDIVIKMINNKDSNLMYSPTTHKMCIKKDKTFITINKNKLKIINDKNLYEISINDRIQDHITIKFTTKLNKKISALENNMNKNVNTNLDDMLKKI